MIVQRTGIDGRAPEQAVESSGAAVDLDSWPARSGYGRAFLKSIPDCLRLTSLAQLEDFYRVAV